MNIATGDDCIAMISGTRNVLISNVLCGPCHGFSVGILVNSDGEDVENIDMRNCTLSSRSNGLRTKTWASPLSKTFKVFNFVYEDIMMNNVYKLIVIDQEYCPNSACNNQVSTFNPHSNSNIKPSLLFMPI